MKAVKYYITFCYFIFFAAEIFSQNPASPFNIPDDSITADFRIGEITIIGNKITKERIIFRELTFHKGDAVDSLDMNKLCKRSEENLLNTSLFNSVHITWVEETGKINAFIIVTERWYIFPIPIFEIAERNFNVWWQTKDFSRIVYGGVLNWNNFRGRAEELAISVRLGYTQRISFYYSIPFINKRQRSGLTFGFAYSRNHQSSVSTYNNQIIYYKDEVLFSKKEFGGSIAFTNRPDLYHSHAIEAGYRYAEVLDTVVQINKDYFSPGEKTFGYSILRYFYKSDHRDIIVYPLKGHYIDFEIVKNGFSFLKDDIDIAYITVHGKKFWELSKRFYFGSGINLKYTYGNNVPYYLNKGLGYGREYLRGYEYYVMDGQNYFLLKTNLKFVLVPQKQVHAGFIPLNKFATIPYAFYLNLYSDAGYSRDDMFEENNALTNSFQYSYGGGIDFVTYYDLVFRFEYSINKLGESGFFLHFTSPI